MESKSLNTKKGIFLVFLSTLIIAFAQLFLKKGAISLDATFSGIFLNGWLLLGIVLYAVATLLFVLALKHGNLSTIYPVLGLGYIWVSLLSFFVLKETITSVNVTGMVLIIGGIVLLGAKGDG